jgi:hypothetical protein
VTLRRHPLCALALLCALAAAAAAAPGRARAAGPSIGFAAETCDLGSVVQGEQPACDFSFVNRGSGDLHVLQVEPSCGCTTALVSAPVLRAGEGGSIHAVFDSGDFAGEVVKEIDVRSDDPARPLVTLRIRAQVEPEIDFEPRVVTFPDVQAGTAPSQVVMVTNRRAEPVRVLSLEARPPSCSCVLRGWTGPAEPLVLEPWDRVPLEVRFTSPRTLPMPLAGECSLEIAGPRKRNFVLKILALPAR